MAAKGGLCSTQTPVRPGRGSPLPAALPTPIYSLPLHLQLASEAQSKSTSEQLHRNLKKSRLHRAYRLSSAKATVEQCLLFQNSPYHPRGSQQRELIHSKAARTSAQEVHRAQRPTFLTSSKDLPLWNTLTRVDFCFFFFFNIQSFSSNRWFSYLGKK